MSEKTKEKGRKCQHCDVTYITTAKGIKEHAEKCQWNKANKK